MMMARGRSALFFSLLLGSVTDASAGSSRRRRARRQDAAGRNIKGRNQEKAAVVEITKNDIRSGWPPQELDEWGFLLDKDASTGFEDTLSHHEKRERLMRRNLAAKNYFKPLTSCNGAIDSAPCSTKFSSLVSSTATSTTELQIPCGQCATMDYTNGTQLELPMGLNVIGKLYFPPTSNMTIRTIHIYVQGVLKMDEPNDGNQVKFLMYGTEDQMLFPHPDNADMCDPQAGCNVSKKAIVFAGGQADINGYPSECPSWVKLQDLKRSLPDPTKTPANPYKPPAVSPCATLLVAYSDFNASEAVNNTSFGGTNTYHLFNSSNPNSGSYLENSARDWYQGPGIAWPKTQGTCLLSNTTYVLSGSMRLVSTTPNVPSSCTVEGTNANMPPQCATATYWYTKNGVGTVRGLENLANYQRVAHENQWFNFSITFQFNDKEIGSSIVSPAIFFNGPEKGVNIDLDWMEVALLNPATQIPDYVSNTACNNLVYVNGNAEADKISAYPFAPSTGTSPAPIIKSETTSAGKVNQYFAIINRRSVVDGMSFVPNSGCLRTDYSQYQFSFKYRLHSNTSDVATLRIDSRRLSDGGWTNGVGSGVCQSPSNSTIGWVDCNITQEIPFNSTTMSNVRFGIWMKTDYSSDLDFDNIQASAVGPMNRVVVGSNAAGCWKPGNEILFTSYQTNQDAQQTAFIASVNASAGEVILTQAIDVPIDATEASDPDYAIEVASLSRKIIFDAEKDDPENDGLLGGHFIILVTSTVVQHVQGVQVNNFGQQGRLGRYPLHFHLCGDVDGSIMTKNVVRNSNQRCIVVHGTHNANVIDNVAYQAFAHCFIVEDGIETGNTFERNLGAGVLPPEIVIPGRNDNEVSVFWITNANNTWIDNVAAGGAISGFWFDCQFHVRGYSLFGNENYRPVYTPVGTFSNNTAHSINQRGIVFYSDGQGWQPSSESLIANSKVYRNSLEGYFIHGNRNILVKGGLVADHGCGIRQFRDGDTRIEDVKVVGFSENYASVMREANAGTLCPNNSIVGLATDTWRNVAGTTFGLQTSNVEFSRLGTDICGPASTAISIESPQAELTITDASHSFQGISFVGDMKRIDSCKEDQIGISSVSIEDLDGTLSGSGKPGFYVSNNTAITAFANGDGCQPVTGACLFLCEGACLRTVRLQVNNAMSTKNTQMVISDGHKNETDNWHHFFFTDIQTDHTNDQFDGSFVTVLPEGNFQVSFRNTDTGSTAWPDYVEVLYEVAPDCANYLTSLDVIRPKSDPSRCAELVKCGTFESSNPIDPWQQSGSLLLNVTSPGYGGSGKALRVSGRTSANTRLSQYLDVSCYNKATSVYQFKAFIRLEDSGGKQVLCNYSDGTCPIAGLDQAFWDIVNQTSTDNVQTLSTPVNSTYPDKDGWYTMSGLFVLSDQDYNATKSQLRIWNPANVEYVVDNISMTPWTPPSFMGNAKEVDNILIPSDIILGVGPSPVSSQGPSNAIDGTGDKYFMSATGGGFEVIPTQASCTIVTGIRVFAGDDISTRDPTSYIVEGRHTTSDEYQLISQGDIFLSPESRNPAGSPLNDQTSNNYLQDFTNKNSYFEYRVTFPTSRGGGAVQVGEVYLKGILCPDGYNPNLAPTIAPTSTVSIGPLPKVTTILDKPINATASSVFGNLTVFAPAHLFDGNITLQDVNTTNNLNGEYAGQGAGNMIITYDMGKYIGFNTIYFAQRQSACDKVFEINIWTYFNNPGALKVAPPHEPAATINITNRANSDVTEYGVGEALLKAYYVVFQLFAPLCNTGGKELLLGYTPPAGGDKTPTSSPIQPSAPKPVLIPTSAPTILNNITSPSLLPPPVNVTASSYFNNNSNYAPSNLYDGTETMADVGTTNNLGGEWAGMGSGNQVVVYDMGSSVKFNAIYYSQRSAACDKVATIQVWTYEQNPGTAASLRGKLPAPPAANLTKLDMADANFTPYYLGSMLKGRYVAMNFYGPSCNPGGRELRLGTMSPPSS